MRIPGYWLLWAGDLNKKFSNFPDSVYHGTLGLLALGKFCQSHVFFAAHLRAHLLLLFAHPGGTDAGKSVPLLLLMVMVVLCHLLIKLIMILLITMGIHILIRIKILLRLFLIWRWMMLIGGRWL